MSWEQFLEYALSPVGIGVIIGFIMFFVIEYVPGYGALDPKWKRLIFLGLAFAIPLSVTVLRIAVSGGDWSSWAGTWWPALVAGFAAFTTGTVAHTPKLKKRFP